jgi:hypothetical protein
MTMNATDNDLCGLAEAAELLGLSGPATLRRLERAGVEPVARLRCGPIWRRRDIVEYARRRASEYHERASVIAAAAEEDGGLELEVEDAARMLGTSAGHLLALARANPRLPARWRPDGLTIPQRALGVWARELGAAWGETR